MPSPKKIPYMNWINLFIFWNFLSFKIKNKYGNTIKPKGYKKKGGNKKEQITPQKNSLII